MEKKNRKLLRKKAARMFMVRSGPRVVKNGWKMALLIEEFGYKENQAATRVNSLKPHIPYSAYKHFKKYQKFSLAGFTDADVSVGPKNHRKGADCEKEKARLERDRNRGWRL